MSRPKKIPTQKDKQIILDAFKAGLPKRRMVANFNYAKSYIDRVEKILIDEGKITEDEIKSAFAKYLKENPVAQRLDKSKVSKPKGREKAEKRHNQYLERKERTFELVKQGYINSQIASIIRVSETVVARYIKDLLEERKN